MKKTTNDFVARAESGALWAPPLLAHPLANLLPLQSRCDPVPDREA
jgi:hypothetical protein